jgi:hypothetical protein
MKCGTVSVDIRMNADRTTPMSEGTSPWYKNIKTPKPNESADTEATMAAQHRPHKAGQGALMPGA